ncbi:MAG: hypothetical protein U0165_06215 [Polyangiaceae bacterium]
MPQPTLPARIGLGLLMTLPACNTGAEKAEARAILRAVDELVQAPAGAKAEPHARLEVAMCSEKSVCGLRDVCVDAFRPLAVNELLQAEIHARIAAASSPSARPSASSPADSLPPLDVLQQRLAQSDSDVKSAGPNIENCLRAAVEVRRARGL